MLARGNWLVITAKKFITRKITRGLLRQFVAGLKDEKKDDQFDDPVLRP
jgi:hypothetical protein